MRTGAESRSFRVDETVLRNLASEIERVTSSWPADNIDPYKNAYETELKTLLNTTNNTLRLYNMRKERMSDDYCVRMVFEALAKKPDIAKKVARNFPHLFYSFPLNSTSPEHIVFTLFNLARCLTAVNETSQLSFLSGQFYTFTIRLRMLAQSEQFKPEHAGYALRSIINFFELHAKARIIISDDTKQGIKELCSFFTIYYLQQYIDSKLTVDLTHISISPKLLADQLQRSIDQKYIALSAEDLHQFSELREKVNTKLEEEQRKEQEGPQRDHPETQPSGIVEIGMGGQARAATLHFRAQFFSNQVPLRVGNLPSYAEYMATQNGSTNPPPSLF